MVFRNCPLELCLSGLMSDPQTVTASPAAKIFFPALMSLSMPFVSQLGQSQLRISRGNLSITNPQWLHRLLLGKKSVNFDQCSPIPFTLIFKLTKHLSPSSIGNRPRQLAVTNHIPDSKVFNSNQTILSNQTSSQLVQKIGTSIFYFRVYLGYLESRFASVARAFGFPTQFLLRDSKLLIQPIEMLWVGYFFSVTGTNQTGNTSVDTNPPYIPPIRGDVRGVAMFERYGHLPATRHKPTSIRFKLDCNCRRTTLIGQKSRPNYRQWLFAFSKPEFSISVLKSRLGKLSRTTIALGFKPGILSSLAPKVSKGFLQMSQTLLQRYTANLVKKLQLFGLFSTQSTS